MSIQNLSCSAKIFEAPASVFPKILPLHFPDNDLFKIKMAIILPTGQWYAPSAVINDAWYYMVLPGIA